MVFKWPDQGFRCGATMISDQMALTAAHCITQAWDQNPDALNMTVTLGDGNTYGIKEFRGNECWWDGQPFAADIAIMVLDRPVPNAVEGKHYIKLWNAEEMGSVAGKEFILAGWGASGAVREDGDESHHQSEIFHRGYNVVNEVTGNMLEYTFDRPADGGLDLEAMGHYGDSGSGALLVEGGEMYIIGVKSNGGPAQWDTTHQYTRVGGYHHDWVEANKSSLNQRVVAPNCGADGGSGGDSGSDGSTGGDGGSDSGSGDAGSIGTCTNTNIGSNGQILSDEYGDACDEYTADVADTWCGNYDSGDFSSNTMCCACGGGNSGNGGSDEAD